MNTQINIPARREGRARRRFAVAGKTATPLHGVVRPTGLSREQLRRIVLDLIG